MAAFARVEVLLIDDFGLRPLTAEQAAGVLEVVEDRSGLRSTIVTSQLPVAQWHEALGDATIADAILDRIVHNAHRIELRGDSLRRPQTVAAPAPATSENAAHAAEGPTDGGRAEKRRATKAAAAR